MTDHRLDEPPSWPRWAARGSIMAAFLSCSINCVFAMLTSRLPPEQTLAANLIVGWLSMAVVVAGLLAGGYALVASIRRNSKDTLLIAALGLILNGGIVFVTLWGLYLVSRTRS